MLQNEYKVSVIMPVYNVKEYIFESLKSVCNQNFSDYQIIIVNDGTEDDSIYIADKLLKESNIDYMIIDQKNSGLSAARNAGLRAATGKYVVFIDSDDIITTDFLETLFYACENHRCNAAFVEYEVVHIENRYGNNCKPISGPQILTRDELLYYNMLRKIKIHLCAVLLNRDFLIKNSLYFNEVLRFGEEVDYTWRLFPLLDQIAYVPSAKYKYLIRKNSLMTSQNIDKVELLLEVVHKNIQQWFERDSDSKRKLKWVEDKIYFEKVHAFAQQASYTTLHSLLKHTNYTIHMQRLKDFPDAKIRILSRLLKYFPYGFWMIFQIIKL